MFHLENHLNLFHRIVNQVYGERQEQISPGTDQMRVHRLQEEEDFNQIRVTEIIFIIETEVLQQLTS